MNNISITPHSHSKINELDRYKQSIVDTINRLMYAKGWSIRQLSDFSDLPYESVKKLVGGKINNPSVYTLIKISSALDCSIDFLTDPKKLIIHNYESLSERALTLLYELADFESHIADYNRQFNANELTTFVPTGNIYDGMVFDSFYTDTVDVSSYYEEFGDIIMCAVKIIGKNLHPTYLNNDILLVGKDRYPAKDEVGIFLIGQRIYIRKYIPGFPVELIPVNNSGNSLIISDISEAHFFGRVLTVVRK